VLSFNRRSVVFLLLHHPRMRVVGWVGERARERERARESLRAAVCWYCFSYEYVGADTHSCLRPHKALSAGLTASHTKFFLRASQQACRRKGTHKPATLRSKHAEKRARQRERERERERERARDGDRSVPLRRIS
jgi:hypothetical protein